MWSKIAIIGFNNITKEILNDENINISKVLVENINNLSHHNSNLLGNTLVENINEIINDEEIKLIVNLNNNNFKLGNFIKCMEKGKHLIFLEDSIKFKDYKLLKKSAEKLNVTIKYSTDSLIDILNINKDNITSIWGILDNVSNNIINIMENKKIDLKDAINVYKSNYNKIDLINCIEGEKSKNKLRVIASNIVNFDIPDEKIYVEGIENINKVDIEYANKFNMAIKLLSILKIKDDQLEARVHPVMMPINNKLVNILKDEIGMIIKSGDYGNFMISNDMGNYKMKANLIKDSIKNFNIECIDKQYKKIKFKDIEGAYTKYYIRININNKPGIIGDITSILGDHDVNIEYIENTLIDNSNMSIVIVTSKCKEIQIIDAIDCIYELKPTIKIKNIIRIENFK